MWVRSQNKEVLIDVKFVSIGHTDIRGIGNVKIDEIYNCKLAEYSTKEKAMKVLDALQCRIARSESGVYQMPEDDE